MEDKTRKKLELIDAKAGLMAEWGFAEHSRLYGFKNNVQWSADNPEDQKITVIDRSLPTKEQITATLLLVRFYTQVNEGICLFRSDWIEPKSIRRVPEWLGDPGLSALWRQHYEQMQSLLNEYLGSYDRCNYTTVEGREVTHGMLFEAYSYGYALHTTELPEKWLRHLDNTLFGIEEYEYDFCKVLLNIILIIQRMAWVTRMELADEPLPNTWPTDTRWNQVLVTYGPVRPEGTGK